MEGARNSDGGGLADHRPADDGGYFVEPEMLTTPTRSSFTEAQSQLPNMQWFPVGPSYSPMPYYPGMPGAFPQSKYMQHV